MGLGVSIREGTGIGRNGSGRASSSLLPALKWPEGSPGEASESLWNQVGRAGAVTEIPTPVLTSCVMWDDVGFSGQLSFLVCKIELRRSTLWGDVKINEENKYQLLSCLVPSRCSRNMCLPVAYPFPTTYLLSLIPAKKGNHPNRLPTEQCSTFCSEKSL